MTAPLAVRAPGGTAARWRHGLAALLCLGALGQALGESRYVTDQFSITLRKGESTRHKILKMLPSGTAVEVLAVNADSGYAQVKVEEDGAIGYVLERQLIDQPVARVRVAELEARLERLQQEPNLLATQLERLQQDYDRLRTDHADLVRRKSQLEEQLATIRHASANILQITEERAELHQSVADLTREVAELQQANNDLHQQEAQQWFVIGAGVVGGGILIGLLLPHLRFQRRRRSWGSL